MAPNLMRRASQAVALNAAANWVGMIGTFLSMIIIARILTPADYGVYVMALIAIAIPEILASGTLGDAIIQRKDLKPGHINSVFLQSVVLAIGFWLLLILLAPLIAKGFNNPHLVPVLIVCGVLLPVGAAISVPAALLQRDLRYKEITLVDVSGTVIAGIVGIVLALVIRNEWALVGMEVSRRLVRLACFFYFAKWAPSVGSNWNDFKDMARFNFMNGASKVLQVIDYELPKTVIGVVLDSTAVGLFNLAERLFSQARLALIDPFAAISLPVASLVQDDPKALHKAMENAIRMSSLLAYPTFIGGLVVAPLAIPVVFGDQWIMSVTIFQIFMILGLRSPMYALIQGVLRGVGRPDAIIGLTIASMISGIILLALTYRYGLLAITLGLAGKQIITFALSTWQIQKIVGFSILSQFKAGAAAFFAATIMGVIVWLLMYFIPVGTNEVIYLASIILTGVVAYPLALFCIKPRLGLRTARAALVFLTGRPRQAVKMMLDAIV